MPANKTLFLSLALVAIVFVAVVTIPRHVVAPPIYPRQVYVTPPKAIPYDNDTPMVSILPLSDVALTSHNITLNFTITKPASWNNDSIRFANFTEYYGLVFNVTYILDGLPAEESMSTPDNWTSKAVMSFGLNLTDLPNGHHSIIVISSAWCLFTPDLYNMRFWNIVEGTSGLFDFTVNVPPKLSINLPENVVYNGTLVPFAFNTTEPISNSWFSLDGGANQTLWGNVTLADLGDGQHSLRVYAQVPWGSIGGSETAYFTVDSPPKIKLLLPIDESYNGTDIPLCFVDDKPVLWAAYSLDGQGFVPITGNTTLTDVTDGSHELVVYAADLYGNVGNSAIVSFSKLPVVAPAPSPNTVYDALENNATLIAGAASVVLVFVMFCVMSYRKRRKDVFCEGNQPQLKP